MTTTILNGDCRALLKTLPSESVHCCVTSPPYFGLRDYGVAGQIGLEPTPDEFVAEMVAVFREVRRVLRNDGTVWLNLGDSYAGGKTGRDDNTGADLARRAAAYGTGTGEGRGPTKGKPRPVPYGLKPKDMIGIPWRVAFALQADGWWLRSDIIWHKPNPMPESVTDRPTSAHEHVFLLAKSERYYFDAEAVKESATKGAAGSSFIAGKTATHQLGRASDAIRSEDGSRNIRNVWTVATQPYSGAHFATFPPALIEPCIKAGCPTGGTVIDPFFGAGTTGLVADRLGRNCVGIELNPEYAALARNRIEGDSTLFAQFGEAA